MPRQRRNPKVEEWTDEQLDSELKRFGLEDDVIKHSFRHREEKIEAVKQSQRARNGSRKSKAIEDTIGWDSEDKYTPSREEARILDESAKATAERNRRIAELTAKQVEKSGGLHAELKPEDVVKARRDLRELLSGADDL